MPFKPGKSPSDVINKLTPDFFARELLRGILTEEEINQVEYTLDGDVLTVTSGPEEIMEKLKSAKS